MKYTDFNQVNQLAANILKDDKKMIQLTADLGSKLKTLKASSKTMALMKWKHMSTD